MILGSISTGFLIKQVEGSNKNKRIKFINESLSIVKAVDHRIAIDGYDPDLWGKLSWTDEKDIVENLIKGELTSQYHDKCEGGSWKPALNAEHNTKLIECNLWEYRRNFGESIAAQIRNDSSGFIQGFDLFINFEDEEDFKKYYKDIKFSLDKIKLNNEQELSGTFINGLVSTSTKKDISSYECISDPLDCTIKLSLERSGGNQYLRADGGNSMINEHLTFIESKGESPLKCIKWSNTEKDGSGTWNRNLDEDCGIGIYSDTPMMVEVVADAGTFQNVMLDRECVVYQWDGSTVKDLGDLSPCGIIKGVDDEIYQIVDNTISNLGVMHEAYIAKLKAEDAELKNLNADNMDIDNLEANTADIDNLTSNIAKIENLTVSIANINHIISPVLNAEYAYVTKQLEVSGLSYFQNEATFNNKTYFNEKINAYDDLYVKGDTVIDEELTVNNHSNLRDGLTVTGGGAFSDNVTIGKNLTISSNGYLRLNKTVTEYTSCTPNGAMARDSSGSSFSCVSGVWRKNTSDMYTRTGSSAISGLRSGKRYLVSVYGITENRGEKNATLNGIKILNSSNVVLASTPDIYINWMDGNTPQSATLVITAPSNGYIRATTDNGAALYMSAVQLN